MRKFRVEITEDVAETLFMVLRRVGGDPRGPRGLMDELSTQLAEVLVTEDGLRKVAARSWDYDVKESVADALIEKYKPQKISVTGAGITIEWPKPEPVKPVVKVSINEVRE